MSFDKFNICLSDTSKLSGFKHDINKIKGYLCDIGNTYLLVAFNVWEMAHYKSYAGLYKNISDACKSELGFKKSTTYNMINIVERFGGRDENGNITYQSFMNNKYSYSQLCEMLSLSDNQLENIKPETTIKEIREIKKVQTSGKTSEPEQERQTYIDVDFVIAENGIEEAPGVSIAPVAPAAPQEVIYNEKDFSYNLTLTESEYSTLKRFLNLHLYNDTQNDFYILSQISQRLRNINKRS